MSEATQRKQEADFSNEVDALTPTVRAEAQAGRLTSALEQIGALEKQARNAADVTSTARLLLLSILLIRTTPSPANTDWSLFCDTAVSLSKKHGQLKSAIARMVQLAMAFLKPASAQQVEDIKMDDQPFKEEVQAKQAEEEEQQKKTQQEEGKPPKKTGIPMTREEEIDRQGQADPKITELMNEGKLIGDAHLDETNRLKLVETLRTITEGKIFVEVERARVTKMLVDMLRSKGEINQAADTLQEVAVETFGSMERREKVEFILDQMRLNFERGDFTRMSIIARKINTKFFADAAEQDLKLDYYQQMVSYAVHEKKYLDVCKYYREIYNTPSIKEDPTKAAEALRNVVVFLVLSTYDNEQSDLMARVEAGEDLDKAPEHRNLLKCFTTPELMRWPGIEALYSPILRASPTFGPDADGTERWETLHNRVVEHNIRVVSKYYTRITLQRLGQLLDLEQDKAEEALADLVANKMLFARIDRPNGIVSFEPPKQQVDILNDWTSDLGTLLGLVERTSHLIGKELAVHRAGLAVREN